MDKSTRLSNLEALKKCPTDWSTAGENTCQAGCKNGSQGNKSACSSSLPVSSPVAIIEPSRSLTVLYEAECRPTGDDIASARLFGGIRKHFEDNFSVSFAGCAGCDSDPTHVA